MLAVGCQRGIIEVDTGIEEMPKEEVEKSKPEVVDKSALLFAKKNTITNQYDIKMQVKDFLKGADLDKQKAQFGYYSYLIFTDDNPHDKNLKAAIRAFMKPELKDYNTIKEDYPEYTPKNYSIFYALIQDDKKPESADDLEKSYDYPRAKELAKHIAKNTGYSIDDLRVSIVSYPVPLRLSVDIPEEYNDNLHVLNLSSIPISSIEKVFLKFGVTVTDDPAKLEKEFGNIFLFAMAFKDMLADVGQMFKALVGSSSNKFDIKEPYLISGNREGSNLNGLLPRSSYF
jgi:hypothetical protein